MSRCDVLIVGGGPAGSTAAAALTRGGFDAVVLDKASFPRDKVCAGWITPAVLEELAVDPEDYRQGGRTLQPIYGFRVGRLGGTAVELRYDEPVSYGILRCELDDFLLRRSGARLRLGTPLQSLERSAGSWIANGDLSAPMLIGAGGHFCPVARHLAGEAVNEEPIVVAQELEILLTPDQSERCLVAPEVPELYFTDDLRGYGWCFRKGRYLNVGLGRQDRSGLRGHVRDFVATLVAQNRIPGDLGERFKGHAYLIHGQSRRPPVADGALLVGDAAGLAYPASGEGIRPAVESGLLAARVIQQAKGYRATELEGYRTLLSNRFGSGHTGVAGLLPAAWRLAAARRLLQTPWFVRRFVVERWFLHRHQEPLDSPLSESTHARVA